MYLHIEDLEAIMDFMKKFEGAEIVEVDADSSSGIGTTITARLHHVEVNGEKVTVSKVISDVENW
jgi:hypothetical protein